MCPQPAQHLAELQQAAKQLHLQFQSKSTDMWQAAKRTHLEFRSKATHVQHVAATRTASGARQVCTAALWWTAFCLQCLKRAYELLTAPFVFTSGGADVGGTNPCPSDSHTSHTITGMGGNRIESSGSCNPFQIYAFKCLTETI